MAETIIFKSKNFKLCTYDRPHLTRADGGHLIISPLVKYRDRLELSPALLVEMAWITQLAGEAMTLGLRKQGIDIGLINYQDNKNWKAVSPDGPYFHLHLYGRAKGATIQKYGEALSMPRPETGFYDSNEPLTEQDVEVIGEEINRLLTEDRYKPENWRLRDDIIR